MISSIILKPETLIPRIQSVELECPTCQNLKYIDGNDIHSGCFDYSQLALHLLGHNQQHNMGESLEYFTFKLFKTMRRINRYMTWNQWNIHEYRKINWNENNWIHELWMISISNSCRNQPCMNCLINEKNKILKHKIMKNEIKKTGFKLHKGGQTTPLREGLF